MRVVRINEVSRELILEFLDSLTSELKFYTDFIVVEDKKVWQALRPESIGLVALDNGKPVSIIYYFTHKSCSDLIGIIGAVTKKEFQNKGINRMLHPLLEELAIDNGIRKLMCGIRAENSRAIWVFTKNGYHITKVNVKSKRYTMEKELR